MSASAKGGLSPAGGNAIRRGDLVLFISFVPDGNGYQANGMDSKQPGFCIGRVKHGRVTAHDNKCWVIPLSEAWRYANSNGEPTTYFLKRTADIGNYLGLGDSLHVRRQIWEAVLNYMPDLLEAYEFEMVKHQRHKRVVVGDIEIAVAGERAGGTEITR